MPEGDTEAMRLVGDAMAAALGDDSVMLPGPKDPFPQQCFDGDIQELCKRSTSTIVSANGVSTEVQDGGCLTVLDE